MRPRVFIAINLPEDIKNELISFQKKWPNLPCRWTKKENLHITLLFLGHLNEEELLKDEKENAEHLMLVDLARSDVGKVAISGTVKVERFRVVERFSHVMHLVTYIKAKINKKISIFELLKSCFPAGTVTGAPKVRAMELIEEVENARRGPYAGSVGYFDEKGNMDQAILIRTIFMKNDEFFYQAGAGIVHDSVPEKEWEECHNKGKVFEKAIFLSEEV